MSKIIIYKIECLKDGKVYVGQTKNRRKRWDEHKYYLRKGIHHSTHLQRAWTKYGEVNFEFSVIEQCDISVADERERYWIHYYDSANKLHGFNLDLGGGTCKELSEETKIKIGKKNKLHYHRKNKYILNSPEAILKRSKSNTGKKRDSDFRKQMSEMASLKTGSKNPFFGQKHSEETKKAIGDANRKNKYRIGVRHSEETKLKISRNRKGLTAGENHPMFGKRHSEEAKRKISEKNKGRTSINRKKVIGTPLDGGKPLILGCIQDGDKYGFIPTGISHCLSGKYKHHKGYTWSYYEES